MTRTSEVCLYCRMYRGGCTCFDYKKCSDCPMPRKVIIMDQHREVGE